MPRYSCAPALFCFLENGTRFRFFCILMWLPAANSLAEAVSFLKKIRDQCAMYNEMRKKSTNGKAAPLWCIWIKLMERKEFAEKIEESTEKGDVFSSSELIDIIDERCPFAKKETERVVYADASDCEQQYVFSFAGKYYGVSYWLDDDGNKFMPSFDGELHPVMECTIRRVFRSVNEKGDVMVTSCPTRLSEKQESIIMDIMRASEKKYLEGLRD